MLRTDGRVRTHRRASRRLASGPILTLATALAILTATCGSESAAGVAPHQVAGSFPTPTWIDTIGPVALSSPTVATIDGVQAVLFGSEDGYLYIVNALTGANLPGWPEPVDIAPGVPTAIESSPTVAYLDGRNRPPTILIGAGSTYVADQQGGFVAFNIDGTVRFQFSTLDVFNEWHGSSNPDGYDEGVFTTPVVGDITGSGQADIVFGSWDHRLYALTRSGLLVPGFPVDTEDTIWSSAALYHVRGPRRLVDIFVGGDASGRDHCYGGFIYDFTYANHKPQVVWQHCESQTIWSSPAIGDINSTRRPVVVVGTGFGYTPPYRSGSFRIFAFYASNGGRVRGWPVHTRGPTFASPAIGRLPGSRFPSVVDTTWCTSCTGATAGTSIVTAWAGDGVPLWSQQLIGANDFASPDIVDLTGGGINDIVVGDSSGLFPLDGGTGQFLFGTSPTAPINGCSMQNSAAIVDVAGTGPASGWRLFEACGGPRQVIASGRLFDYPLPYVPAVRPPWPMWRQGPYHLGVANTRVP